MDEKLKAEILENDVAEEKTEEIKEKVKEELKEEKNNETKKNEKIEEKKEEPKTEQTYAFKQSKQPKKGKNKSIVIIIIIFILLIIIGAFSTIFALINSSNEAILKGVSIRNINMEGLTIEDATKLLNQKFEEEKTREIQIVANGETFTLVPEQLEVTYHIDEAIDEAYNIGRNGNIIKNNFEILKTMFEETKIDLEVTYNEENLNNFLKEINIKMPEAMQDNTYSVEEDDKELVITRGKAGKVIDTESAKELIINAIKTGSNDVLTLKIDNAECPEIDIEKIHEEVKSEPQDATYTTDPFEIIPHKNGIDFDVEKAKEALKEQKDEYVIDLIITEPKVHTNEIGEEAFPDLLSSFSTKYDESNVPRSKNLKIALSKLNGVVIMPGEVFSYNKTLGKRTVEEGYQYANGFAGGKVVPMLAGGICQISSTLYDAALYANMKIVERHNHMFQAGYVEPGKDATVVYGSLDFQFENTRKYPVMLKTKSGGGLAEIKIFGIKEEVEYDIEIITEVQSYTSYNVVYENDTSLAPGTESVAQWGLKGCRSKTYRIISLNGQEISKELLSTDSYSPLNKIIKRGVSKTPAKPETSTTTTPEKPSTPETPSTPTKPETPTTPEKPGENNNTNNTVSNNTTGNTTGNATNNTANNTNGT